MLIFDELDEASPSAKAMAKERLAHSEYKRIIELSNPSVPDYLIDASYQKSDQRHWTLKCPACAAWTALDKEFPQKLGQEVRIILPRLDGTFYRACPKCHAELDLAAGEWVADFPSRPIHGYRISQLFSCKVDPGEILEEYRTTNHPERFYNLKIGIPWADTSRRVDAGTVLSLCDDRTMEESCDSGWCTMGVDTGRHLHVVILREGEGPGREPWRLIHVAVCREFSELDQLMDRFAISSCVIDGLPETHATREFAVRHPGRVLMSFFNENQRGSPSVDEEARTISVNRTEALDISRAVIREKRLVLPRGTREMQEFADHIAADSKVLQEDPETGIQKYRYIRTGENHFSMAFTYAWLAKLHGPRLLRPEDILVDFDEVNLMEERF